MAPMSARPTSKRRSTAEGGKSSSRPASAEMTGSRTVQRLVSKHLSSLLTARHLHHSPERRFESGEEAFRSIEAIPRIGNTLVPYRIHEPAAHAQRISQLCYERYKKNEDAMEAGLAARMGDFPVAKTRTTWTLDAFHLLPNSWRPTWKDVATEAAVSKSSLPLAAASLIAGRTVANVLQPRSVWPEECELQKLSQALETGPLLDLKAWVRLANASSSRGRNTTEVSQLPTILSMPEKVLAVIFLLYDVSAISQIDLSSMGLEEVPASLRAFRGIRSIDLSLNRNLVSLGALAGLSSLEALRLCGCQKLSNVKALSLSLQLVAVDFSGCELLHDVTPLLGGGYDPPADRMAYLISTRSPHPSRVGRVDSPTKPHPEKEELEDDVLLKCRKRDALGEQDLWPPPVRLLGHPSLRWLCFNGCKALRGGLDHLPRCPELRYVDLYGCENADSFSCFIASAASKMEHFVWPSLEQLMNFIHRAALPDERSWELMHAAVTSVEEKKRAAENNGEGQERPERILLPMQKLVRNTAREAALKAAQEMGLREVRPPKPPPSKFPEVISDTDEAEGSVEGSEHEEVQERGNVEQCIRPFAFVRKLKAEGFRPGTALQGTRLFAILDRDRDGVLSKKDFSLLDLDFAGPEPVNDAIGRLLQRHDMVHDVVARDLAGNQNKLDKKRLVECMVIAGVEEELAGNTARCLLHCARSMFRCALGRPDACKVAIQHSLGAGVVVYTLELLSSLQKFLEEKTKNLKKAFRSLDVTERGRLTFEDFESGLKQLGWPEASISGLLEVIFRILDRDGTGAILEKDFSVFQNFDKDKMLESMVRVGRSLVKFPKECPKRFVEVKLDLLTYDAGQRASMSRNSFVSAWKEFGSKTEEADAKMVFGILDFDEHQRIFQDRLLILSDALPKRSEFFGLWKLKAHLQKTHGSLQAAFVALSESASVVEEKVQLEKGANRRVSF